ncbi:MAG: TonB-dependent receptor [Chitinophagales bacterium]|nr:TonB-dependent receptor [Chitinophagales bacterium]MCZ2394127.1 TonB-dependent receptor [Chitinophagales bacterium]
MKHIILIFSILSVFTQLNAQSQIMVHVEDAISKEPLIGAGVVWAETKIGSATDISGMTFIPKPSKYPSFLIVSYVGYQTDTIEISTFQAHLHVGLKSSIVLDEVEIKAKQKDNFFKSLDPLKTEVVSQNELRKAACCNLSESFQTNASAQVNFEDAVTGAKQIQLLGLKGIYVQNTIENTPSLRGLSSSFALDNVPAPWLKTIEVSKGTPSVRSGYEGITGSININYKEPEELSPLYLDVFANHTGRLEGNLITGVHKNKWGTALFANGAMTKDKKDRNGDTFYDQPQVGQINLMNRWVYNGDKMESKFMIKGLHEDRTSGQLSLNEGQSHPYKINIKTNRIEGFGKMGFFLPGLANRSIGITASGFWHDQKGKYGLNNYDGVQGSFFGNLQYQGIIKNTNHSLFLGASIMYDTYNEKINSTKIERVDIVPGLSTEYTYKYLEKITLVAGLRADFPNHFKPQINPRIHFRYEPITGTQLRVAGGRGFRIPNVYAENIYMFASSRLINVIEQPLFESAWNTGISVMQDIPLGDIKSKISIDFFHTRFTHQAIVDIENGHNEVQIYNLNGKSYSNSFMTEWTITPVLGLDIKAAYRLEDVHQTMHGKLLRKNMLPLHRGLFAVTYKTKDEHWMLSGNLNINGKARFPLSFENSQTTFSPISSMLNLQVTRYQNAFEFFFGGENLLNVRQKNPIIGANDPFGSNFDTYQVWGSVIGPVAYGGVRYNFKNKKSNQHENHY